MFQGSGGDGTEHRESRAHHCASARRGLLTVPHFLKYFKVILSLRYLHPLESSIQFFFTGTTEDCGLGGLYCAKCEDHAPTEHLSGPRSSSRSFYGCASNRVHPQTQYRYDICFENSKLEDILRDHIEI